MESPEIKSYWCSEVDDLDKWMPEDPQYVDLWFQVAIGLKDDDRADDFQIHLATEAALKQIEKKEYLLVIAYYYSWSEVMIELQKSIQNCCDMSWIGMSAQLAKLYYWEYHEYKP